MQRAQLKKWLFKTLGYSGVTKLMRYKYRKRMRILSFHGVIDDSRSKERWNSDGFFVSESLFREQMAYISTHFNPVPLGHSVEAKCWPDNAAALTFDDGFLNNATIAAPILRELNIPATFFITTGFIDKTACPWWMIFRSFAENNWAETGDAFRIRLAREEKELRNLSDKERMSRLTQKGLVFDEAHVPEGAGMMSWDHIEKLAQDGFEIGAHTVHHLSMGHDTQQIHNEIIQSTERLRQKTTSPIHGFSYPYGAKSNLGSCLTALQKGKLNYAVTDIPGWTAHSTDPYLLPRFAITGRHQQEDIDVLLSGCRTRIGQ